MTPEAFLKRQILEVLLRLGYVVIRLNSGGNLSAPCVLWYEDVFKARNKGVFDILAVGWNGMEILHIWIDTKATGKPSPEQLEFKTIMETRGDRCLFVHSLDELLAELQP